jgi:hypothetical protein
MLANIAELDQAVNKSIFNLFRTFAKSPGMFWSEGDVESFLFSLLINEPVFQRCSPNLDCENLKINSFTTLVHTQTKVFPKRMGRRINDIAIIIPNEEINYPDTETVIGIEIKFNRKRPARDEKASIMNDIRKVKDNEKGYVLLLNWDRPINTEHLDTVIRRCGKYPNVKFYFVDVSSGGVFSNFPKALT